MTEALLEAADKRGDLLKDRDAGGAGDGQEQVPTVLLGDEAVALAALHAGISAAYAYPGTPSTEIFEYLEAVGPREFGITAHWAVNEKTAFEQALGASMMGRRVLVSMKHVGLNVAADPFVNSALVGIRGGLVLAVADDPGMHSSQNEQDSRWLADFARIPCLEPANQQEAYDMTRWAFDFSERMQLPVMVRMVTRLCHSRAGVAPAPPREQRALDPDVDPMAWTLLPANARRLWAELVSRASEVEGESAAAPWNRLQPEREAPSGSVDLQSPPDLVITAGIARNYLMENLAEVRRLPRLLHLGMFPIPEELVRRAALQARHILVLEDGYPYVERLLKGVLPRDSMLSGRLDGTLPATGELDPDVVRSALGLPAHQRVVLPQLDLPVRPPQLCKGCPHGDVFSAVNQALADEPDALVAGDIGCYTLGALPPYQAMESCVCMGASIGMAKGAADAGLRPVLAVIGDSTFLHSGVPPLMDAVAHDTPMTVLVLDNETVAMTGQQATALPASRLVPLILGLGVDPDHFHVVEPHPKRTGEIAKVIRREMDHPGLSVILAVRECVVSARRKKAQARKEESR